MLPRSFLVSVTPRQVHVRYDAEPGLIPSGLIQSARTLDAFAVIQGSLLGDGAVPAGVDSHPPGTFARQLIEAYREQGVEGLAALEGDFAFCLIDFRSRTVLAGRDEMGGYPLFWKRSPSGFQISSSHRSLCAGNETPVVDPHFIAGFLMLPNAGMNEVPHEVSAFTGHTRVLPGQIVEFRLNDRPESRVATSYWSQHFTLAEQSGTTDKTVRQIRAGLELAVGRRMSGTIGSHFSGGIDSTGVALLAARLAGGHGAARPVHGFARVFPELRHLAQEQHYIDCAASLEPGLSVHHISAARFPYYSEIDSLPLYDEPHPGLSHAHESTTMCDSAVQAGVNVLMTGVGGDHLFDASLLVTVADAIARGRFRKALSMAESAGRQFDESRWSLMRQSLPYLLPARFRSGIGPWLRRGHASWMQLTDQTIPPWINPHFARRFDMFDRAISFLPRRLVRHSDAANGQSLGLIRQQAGDCQRWYPALRAGMQLSHPFFDRQLVATALRIASTVRCQPGRQKWLLTTALSDVLPREIIERRRKGHFGELVDSGFAARQNVLADLIDRAPVDGDVISKPVLHQCLQFAACGAYRDVRGLDRLNLTLSLLHWLDRLPAWRAEPVATEAILNETWPAHVEPSIESAVGLQEV